MLVSTARRQLDVTCSGKPRDLGLTQGEILRSRIHAARAALEELEGFRLEQPWWLPFRAFRRLAESKAERLLAHNLTRQFPESSARLMAIAEGAGMHAGAIYLLNAVESLLSAVRDHIVVPPPGACSAIAIRGRRSSTGEPIIAKNFDYLPLVQPFFVLRETKPDAGWRSVEFTVAPLVGAVDGMNECGLAITNNYAFTTDTAAPTATITMVIAEALMRCSTVAEAADWIAAQPRWGAGLLMLADASGDIASLELSSTRCRLRRPEPDQDLIFHTNAYSCPEMRDVQVPWDAVFTKHAPACLQGTRLHESAEQRDGRLDELLQQPGPLGPQELANILADHGPEGVPNENSLCVHSDYWNTTASLQFFPARRTVHVDFAPTCQAQHQQVQWNAT